MSRLQSFRGTFGGNSGSNVFNSGQSQVLDNFAQTPTPKPMKSTRSGKTFSGTVTSRLPRASNIDPGFGAMNLPADGREAFGRLGARAGDQSVDSWNSGAAAFNKNSLASKQAEISSYDKGISDYQKQINTYDTASGKFNERQAVLNDSKVQEVLGLLNASYGGPVVNLQNPDTRPVGAAPGPYQAAILRGLSVFYSPNNNGQGKYLQARDYPELFSGKFDPHNITDSPVAPTAPTATRPNPIAEQRQMQDSLPSRLERRLASNQREIVGGDLPPQVAGVSGDTFASFDVQAQPGDHQGRPLDSFNQSEQQTLGAPKAYRAPSWYWTAKGQSGGGGGQTISPSDITNQNSTSFYIRNYGWILKSQMTPLY